MSTSLRRASFCRWSNLPFGVSREDLTQDPEAVVTATAFVSREKLRIKLNCSALPMGTWTLLKGLCTVSEVSEITILVLAILTKAISITPARIAKSALITPTSKPLLG